MRVAVGADHAGFPLKGPVIDVLRERGHEVVDCGTDSAESVDYPVHAAGAARMVSEGNADFAILACGTGAGMSIAANKFAGVRAVNALDPEAAAMARRHNDANVLCLAGRRLSIEQALAILDAWLGAEFDGGRHERRVRQIEEIERGKPPGSIEHPAGEGEPGQGSADPASG